MKCFVLFGLTVGALCGQALQFEVASIRPSAQGAQGQVNLGLHLDGTQASINAFTMRQYIGMAYQLRLSRISGPDWITTERFDIRATLPQGANTKQIPQMLEALLADRFGLKTHKGQKDLQVYVLEQGKRPLSLKPAADQNTSAPNDVNVAVSGSSEGVSVDLGGGASYTFANNKFEGRKLNMATLVNTLESYMNLPVVDQTNLSGFYDVSMEITAEDFRAMLIRVALAGGVVLPPQAQQFADSSATPSLFEAIDKLGLRLKTRRMPMDVLVVDEIRRTPTDN